MGDESREIGESNYLTREFNDFTQEIDIPFFNSLSVATNVSQRNTNSSVESGRQRVP